MNKRKFKVLQKDNKSTKPLLFRKNDISLQSPVLYDMTLQKSIGNQDVKKLFEAGEIQARLYVSNPKDQYEREADKIAEQVITFGENEINQKKKNPGIQRSALKEGNNTVSEQIETKITAIQGLGQPVQKHLRDYFEPRFGVDLGNVHIHTDSNADRLAKAINARAFTLGKNIFFAKGEYKPGTHEGKKLMAHELAHVLQQGGIKKGMVMRQTIGEQYGQAAASTTRHLICDLSSPIIVGSNPRYEIRQHGAEIGPTGAVQTFRWRKHNIIMNSFVLERTTRTPEIQIPATDPGYYQISVDILINGNVFTSLSLYQTIMTEDLFLTSNLGNQHEQAAKTYRELVNDFRAYIIDAANGTGPMGITPLFLASVLFVEVFNRPKEGRENEIRELGDDLAKLEKNGWLLFRDAVNRSIGVGQIRLSTAAMALGYTPWIDQNRDDRGPDRDRIEENYHNLNISQKKEIFQLLKWPKSNIKAAATLLNRLKNRMNRYPGLSRVNFGANERAIGIIASEYNLGPSDTTEADAAPSDYGRWVWDYMTSDTILMHFFPNT